MASIKPRSVYIDDRLIEQQLVRAAEAEMRASAQTLTRSFFFKKYELGSSFSIGDTRDGFLIQGKALPSPSLLLRQLPVQYERGLAYGTDELIELLVDCARSVDLRHPDSIMFLGNVGRREGGDIPYSISHNAGRDVDIAFYTEKLGQDENLVDNLLKFGRSLTSRTEDGQVYHFDCERNASLVEFLLSHPKHQVQFIFVAKHIRQALYRTLVKRDVDPETLERFQQVVYDDAAHSDHYHVRIYCSKSDICAGCADKSVIHPWHEDPLTIREACVQTHCATLGSSRPDAAERAAAIQRLAFLDATECASELIFASLSDPSIDVRRAAVFALRDMIAASSALGDRLAVELEVDVRLDILAALAHLADDESHRQFKQFLLKAATLEPELYEEIVDEMSVILKHYQRHPHAEVLESLLSILEKTQDPLFSRQIRETVAVISNHGLCEDLDISNASQGEDFQNPNLVCAGRYRRWLEGTREQARTQWLLDGMQAAGFAVNSLDNEGILPLLDAIDGPRHVSINAQIELRRISGLEQDSLNWSTIDARWHYTRYFKRRQRKYKLDLSDRNERGIKY